MTASTAPEPGPAPTRPQPVARPTAQPDADPGGVAEAVAAGRARIDQLDHEIRALVRQRVQVSQGIQQVRLAAGGRRVEHSREVDVVNRYATELGQSGADLALALLALSRGASPAVVAAGRSPQQTQRA